MRSLTRLLVLVCLLSPVPGHAGRPERTTFADLDALIASPLDSGPVRVRGCLYYTATIGAHLFADCDAMQDEIPVSVALDFRKALPAIIRWRQKAFACIEFAGEWTRYPTPEIVGWARDHGKLVATFAMTAVKGCGPLNAPTGLDAGIAAADLVVRFESAEDAVTAVESIVEHVAALPPRDRPATSPRSDATLRRWQDSGTDRVARAAAEVETLVRCRAATSCTNIPETSE